MAKKCPVFFRILQIICITALFCVLLFPVRANVPGTKPDLVQQGRVLYQSGKFPEAVKLLQQAVDSFRTNGDSLREAMTWSNISLTYQQLGLWTEAESAIAKSLNLLQNLDKSPEHSAITAQVLDVKGQLQLALSKTEAALTTWQEAAEIYRTIGDTPGLNRNQVNSAQALQSLGLYRQASKMLMNVEQNLKNQPNASLKAAGMRSLGEVLQVVGDLSESRRVLQQSLLLAPNSETLFSLGNTTRAQRDTTAAFNYYQQAISTSTNPTQRIQAQLNQLSLFVETKEYQKALNLASKINSEIDKLPANRTTIYQKINFAHSLMILSNLGHRTQDLAILLASSVKQAHIQQDNRAESYALGTLGELYEQAGQFSDAQKVTEKALLIASNINASDITYQWQWQMGRLLKKQLDNKQAIAYYTEAFNTLQSLRRDLVAINPDIQFSFRESVEPVYRELVGLLLQSPANPKNLKSARFVIESLQLAELNNYFRTACLEAKQEIDPVVDKKDQQAAIIYPIILQDSVDVILKLPNQQLRHYKTLISNDKVEDIVGTLDKYLGDVTRTASVKQRSQQIYDWLIRPLETELGKNGVQTLVFVLDGSLRNIPMSVLYDKQQQKYLFEKYAIALTPGLQLVDPKPLQKVQLNVLTAGVSEERFIENREFSPLKNVSQELQRIQLEIPTNQKLFNQDFTGNNLQKRLQNTPFSVVHLATHGEFSSDSEKTFVVVWDKLLKVKEFDNLLRANDQNSQNKIELLVLSACKTAEGDKRAALGLAGVAVRAGARSTLATLWSVDDQSTADLMTYFYRYLTAGVNKAEALQQAQLAVFAKEKRPYFWAPFVLLGNWL
ncbi:MAG: CHAT domain-containing protein [Cyanomargarita calcarea GSE-NOS-MK-12-04C]|jgi:CHAT domain-containing protein|uniref:CHAT domain-containing protein n=1 Tax=Cyanomargarita calcarea GSE-NOS-MK-12-04C TaxID=2839659 RepID=A0A951URV3_9CYAN|nr:CHAT domain-containing protein [Cyanomargarita calcarea GSE-NOS-MK-12-04C]